MEMGNIVKKGSILAAVEKSSVCKINSDFEM